MTSAALSPIIKRDRWGRPLIVPPTGGKPVAYTRISTLAKALDDGSALANWKCRMTAIGLAKRPDLVSKTLAVLDNKQEMGKVVKSALEAAEADRAANIGTALHRFCEMVDSNQVPSNIPPEHLADLVAYRQAMSGLTIEATELFVVVDEIQAAGSFDRLVRLPDGRVVVADIKTGQTEPDYPHGVTQQVAMYSRGHVYDPEKGRVGRLADWGVSQDVGLMIHLPSGQGQCTLYLLDLNHGWALAQIAVAVRNAYKTKPLTKWPPDTNETPAKRTTKKKTTTTEGK